MSDLVWNGIKRINRFAPTIGGVIFIALYIYAALLYPGGSDLDPKAVGFSFTNNYWCNLLGKYAFNGQINPARPYAITAMIFLCFALGNFFYFIPLSFKTEHLTCRLIQISGNISMLFVLLIFTNYHDLLITISSVFALIALVLVFIVMYDHNQTKLLWMGIISVALLAINGYIYGTQMGIHFLPLIQKFTFLIVFTWIVTTNIEIDRKMQEFYS